MDDLATTLHAIDRNAAPDLWEEIGHRLTRAGSRAAPQAWPQPRVLSRGSRLLTIFVAIAVGVAGSVFVVRAFHGSDRSVPSDLGSPPLSIAHEGCGDAVRGNLPPGWKNVSAISGRIAFVWLPQVELIPSGSGTERRAAGSKVLILVKNKSQVMVSIAEADRGSASLNYPSVPPQNRDGSYRLDQGHDSVTFTACTGRQHSWRFATQFIGGVLATGPMCLHLDVTSAGEIPSTVTVSAPMGEGTTCPPSAG
jgi:hypothetical protein